MAILRYDLSNKKFGEYTVLGKATRSNGRAYHETKWRVQCSCGSPERHVFGKHLMSQSTTSCHGRGRSARTTAMKFRKEGTAKRAVYRDYYRSPARKRNLEFSLTIEEFLSIVTQPCFYCGISPSNSYTTRSGETFIFNGIDRRDNLKGYILENSVPCCRPCNVGKNAGTETDYIERCKRVAILHAV